MRNYVDPKRFYKASDKVSKFMQVRTRATHVGLLLYVPRCWFDLGGCLLFER